MKVLLILACLTAAILTAIVWERPGIVLGFSGQLTGRFSDLGVPGRNGATLAVEEINAAGGVAGRRLKLVAADDGETPERARLADQTLLDAGAVAIIGHMTSAQSLAALPLVEKRGGLLVSPTSSTHELTGRQDAFFRLTSDNSAGGQVLAGYALHAGTATIFLLGDSDNASYVESVEQAFAESYTREGGRVVGQERFSSRAGEDWRALAERIRSSGAEGVLLCASARDVAAFARAARPSGFPLALYCPGWPYTREILLLGGECVEGVVFATNYPEDESSPGFARFAARYEQRFGWPPTFAAAYSYEAVLVLAKALARTGGQRQGLEKALVSVGPVEGVQRKFQLDDYGDVRREISLMTVAEGRFRSVGHEP